MKLNPLIVFREDFENSAVLFNPEDGKILGLNPTGAFIWRALEKNESRDEIIAGLRGACGDTAPAELEADVDAFLQQLRERAFLTD